MASKAVQRSAELTANLLNLQDIRKNAHRVLSKINAQHEKARAKGTTLSEKQVEKLRGLYEQAYTLSQDERQVAIAAAQMVHDLGTSAKRKSANNPAAGAQGEAAGGAGAGSGRGKKRRSNPVQQHPISEGAMVAASHDEQWIVGRVQEFDYAYVP